MNLEKPDQKTFYEVVINDEEQYSLWPISEDIPTGWNGVGFNGEKDECLSYIKKIWTDMMPLSLRKRPISSLEPERGSFPNQRCMLIHHFFEKQVLKAPDSIAVVFQKQRITYEELHHYSNQIANYLQDIGIGPENAVGLCVDRSIDMIACFFGILKSGGVYVPLDPLYPSERLQTISHEAHLSALIVQEKFLERLSGTCDKICCIDRDQETIRKRNIENVETRIHPENLSHIIFTSGSTGTPKGVMMPHISLCSNLTGFCESVNILPSDIYLHTASIAFTSSLRQILAPLSCGAKIVIAEQEQRTNPTALFKLINNHGVTIWDTVASFWETCTKFLQQKSSDERETILNNKLRLILSSGGELPVSIIQTWRKLSKKKTVLINMYGQTETNGNILSYNIPEQFEAHLRVVPLGPPIKKTQVYILDENARDLPQGKISQLHIGGGSLARGYINQPDLTAEKFIPDPFSDIAGSRLFISGDQGSFLSRDTICFTGRSDFQVSIRGFRIELGEVEAALKLQRDITGAVVTVYEHSDYNKELFAYLEAEQGGTIPIVDELRNFLSDIVPEYMIPSRYIWLESLPRLPNGKINRQGLPAPQLRQNRPELSSSYVAPGNSTERIVADIWQAILEIEKVGVDDNFFDLGGNSLLAALVIDRLCNHFKMDFPISMLFERPTVHSFSKIILEKDSECTNSQNSFDRGKKRKNLKRKRSRKN